MAAFGKVELEGYDEVRRAIRHAEDRELPKRLGQAHKDIGQKVIDLLSPPPVPEAVGEGAGATVRPSASKREVLLRVGGKHRAAAAPMAQWGKKRVLLRGRKAPERPYIRQTAEDNRPYIEREFLEAVTRAMSGAFHEVDPR